MSDTSPKPKSQRAKVQRPDELSAETFEFIAAIDDFKRTRMVSVVTLQDVVTLLSELGYLLENATEGELVALEAAVERYKKQNERLFPNWSEIFHIALDLGYARQAA